MTLLIQTTQTQIILLLILASPVLVWIPLYWLGRFYDRYIKKHYEKEDWKRSVKIIGLVWLVLCVYLFLSILVY